MDDWFPAGGVVSCWLALLVAGAPLTGAAAELSGRIDLAPASPNAAVSGQGYEPLRAREPEGRIWYPMVPTDGVVAIATPRDGTAVFDDSPASVTLLLSLVSDQNVVVPVGTGTTLILENDTDRARQVRLDTGHTTVIDPDASEEIAGQMTEGGLVRLSVQATTHHFMFVVIDGPFAQGRLEYDRSGELSLQFGDVINQNPPEEAILDVVLWYRGEPVCPAQGPCLFEGVAVRDERDDMTLRPIPLSLRAFLPDGGS